MFNHIYLETVNNGIYFSKKNLNKKNITGKYSHAKTPYRTTTHCYTVAKYYTQKANIFKTFIFFS